MARFSARWMFVALCLVCACETSERMIDRPPLADQLFVQLGEQSWEFVSPMGFAVYFWDDGPGVIAMTVSVPEVFSLHVQGPTSMLPAFSVPLVEKWSSMSIEEGVPEAQLVWINEGYTMAASGQVEIAIEHDRIVGHVAEHHLSFRSARTLGCAVRAETIPNYPQEVSVSDNGFPMLVGDNHFASPQCAALKASLP